MMKKIEVFYYIYIPPDLRAVQWSWFINEQLGVLVKSGLVSKANINIIACMPRNWYSMPDGRLIFAQSPKIGDPPMYFDDKFQEYLSFRYPFAKIIEIVDTKEPNLYEEVALKHVYNLCLSKENIHVLYYHSKGMTKSDISLSNWREALNYHLVENWKECIHYLNEGYDVCAMADLLSYNNNLTVSGNFFWANSSYIQTLPSPSDIKNYASRLWDPINLDANGMVQTRLAYELWIRANNPKLKWIHNSCKDHYSEYYFVENLSNV